jgi:hypothetical protein
VCQEWNSTYHTEEALYLILSLLILVPSVPLSPLEVLLMLTFGILISFPLLAAMNAAVQGLMGETAVSPFVVFFPSPFPGSSSLHGVSQCQLSLLQMKVSKYLARFNRACKLVSMLRMLYPYLCPHG